MFATTIILFREVLEAALIIGIVMAATRGVAGRGRWVIGGIGAGLSGAALVATFAGAIATALSGIGQEVFNAAVLFAAVAMLAWTNIWMHRHGRQITARMKRLGRGITQGELPLHALAVVVGLAVLREGSEVVLFLHGIAAQQTGVGVMYLGSALGVVAGAIFGLALYFGLLRIPTRYLFSVTGWLILLLAAGMAAQGAGYLVQAGLLPPLGDALWNTSSVLSERSILGQLLHTLVGYVSRPAGIQVLFYVLTIVFIGGLMRLTGRHPETSGALRSGAAVTSVALLAAALTTAPPPVHAHHKVYSPRVERGELELETRGHGTTDGNPARDHLRRDRFEIGYGLTDRWFASVFFDYQKAPGEEYSKKSIAWENIIQLTEPGQYWLDAGLYMEYKWPADGSKPDKVEIKLLLEKSVNRFVHTANLELEKEVGSGAEDAVEVGYAWRSAYRYDPRLEFGVEAYGSLGDLDNLRINDRQSHVLGPVVRGKFGLGRRSALVYEVGYLFGLTRASSDGTFKWLLEYEVHL